MNKKSEPITETLGFIVVEMEEISLWLPVHQVKCSSDWVEMK